MKQSQCKADAMNLPVISDRPAIRHHSITYRKYAIAFPIFTIHLDIIEAPFFYELYDGVCLHGPCQYGIEGEYDLERSELVKGIIRRTYGKANTSSDG